MRFCSSSKAVLLRTPPLAPGPGLYITGSPSSDTKLPPSVLPTGLVGLSRRPGLVMRGLKGLTLLVQPGELAAPSTPGTRVASSRGTTGSLSRALLRTSMRSLRMDS